MTAQQRATYDESHLRDPQKILALARWILSDPCSVAREARSAMHVPRPNLYPSSGTIRATYVYLYAETTDVARIIGVYTAPRPAPPRRR
jgi:hypothetical protein